MTLDSNLSKAVYQGNGSTTVFPFAFKVWDTSQISVTMTDAAGVSTDVTSNSTVTLTTSGGSVTYPKTGSPLPSGAKLAITRNMPFTQGINLVSASRFDPQVLEDGLDQATAERQQTLEIMARAVILPPTSSESPQDVVASIYASRYAAAASANDASAQATAAAESVADATVQATSAQNAAAAAAQSALDAAAAVPDTLVGRVTNVEGVAAASKTITDKATTTPTAGGMPIAGTDKHLELGWFGSMLCNVREVLTTSGAWTAPVTGWYRVTCIGGGGGGSRGHVYISSIGTGGAGGGGGSGYISTAFKHITASSTLTYTVGAGGAGGTTNNGTDGGDTTFGTITAKGGRGSIWSRADYSSIRTHSGETGGIGGVSGGTGGPGGYSSVGGTGGCGGATGLGFGGGGGGGAGGGDAVVSNGLGGAATDGGTAGAIASTATGGNGGNGGNGAVILEYFNPAVTA